MVKRAGVTARFFYIFDLKYIDMALVFDNCLVQQGEGTNFMYGGCCCSFECIVTNTEESDIEISDFVVVFNNGLFAINYFSILYNGSTVSAPFTVGAGQSFLLGGEYCAGNVADTDTLVVEALIDGKTVELFNFDFEAIDMSTTVDTPSIDFETVNVNTINPVNITITNPTVCCYNYNISTDCVDLTIVPIVTEKLCLDGFESVAITWQPTTAGAISCNVYIDTDCQQYVIPITGTAVAPPTPAGSTTPQKNKVDQTTRVEACSPRTANNRCQTARTMQSAIRTNARRFGKR